MCPRPLCVLTGVRLRRSSPNHPHKRKRSGLPRGRSKPDPHARPTSCNLCCERGALTLELSLGASLGGDLSCVKGHNYGEASSSVECIGAKLIQPYTTEYSGPVTFCQHFVCTSFPGATRSMPATITTTCAAARQRNGEPPGVLLRPCGHFSQAARGLLRRSEGTCLASLRTLGGTGNGGTGERNTSQGSALHPSGARPPNPENCGHFRAAPCEFE